MRWEQIIQKPLEEKSLEFQISDIIELLDLKVKNNEVKKQMVNRAKNRDCEESHDSKVTFFKNREQYLRADEDNC